MSKIDISTRYIENEEIRRNKLPYLDYYKCLKHTFGTIDSLCDVGCATGHLLYFIKKDNSSADVKGIEYFEYHKRSPYCEDLIHDSIEIADIRDPLPAFTAKYDIVNCSEVGENIDPAYTDIFVQNVKRLSKKYILFTWSSHGGHLEPKCDPHQQHLNPLKRDAYIALMRKHGLKENVELTNKFLQFSHTLPNFHFWWRESFVVWELPS